jgi:predicted 3-demethylubiquinone-9 3-methyltransferase (glyoxalase superfamily)
MEFTLQGRPFLEINAGPLDPFNHAVSFVITCRACAKRVAQAMLGMIKLDIAGLQKAYDAR